MNKRAFTMIELMVVISIIAVIAALIFPVVARSKEDAYRTSAASNMHQCFIAFTLYANDNDEIFPTLDATRKAVPRDVTYDHDDCWRPNPNVDWPLMLGSFGDAFDTMVDMNEMLKLSGDRPAPLLVSIFHQQPEIHAFQGDTPPDNAAAMGWNVAMPTRVLALRTDGVAKMESVPHLIESSNQTQGFTWSSMYFALATKIN